MRVEKSMQGLKAEDTQKCPECGSRDIAKRKGELFCNACGFVIDD